MALPEEGQGVVDAGEALEAPRRDAGSVDLLDDPCRKIAQRSTSRQANHVLVVTETYDLSAARDLLERVIAGDRSDLPATARRRDLARRLGVGRSEAAPELRRNGIDAEIGM